MAELLAVITRMLAVITKMLAVITKMLGTITFDLDSDGRLSVICLQSVFVYVVSVARPDLVGHAAFV